MHFKKTKSVNWLTGLTELIVSTTCQISYGLKVRFATEWTQKFWITCSPITLNKGEGHAYMGEKMLHGLYHHYDNTKHTLNHFMNTWTQVDKKGNIDKFTSVRLSPLILCNKICCAYHTTMSHMHIQFHPNVFKILHGNKHKNSYFLIQLWPWIKIIVI